MANNATILQAALNAAIEKALKANPNVNGTVYVEYSNEDLGIEEQNLTVHA